MDLPTGWHPYPSTAASTVVGTLLRSEPLPANPLPNRSVLAWLPDSHRAGDRSYPVLYMHDGDNLFDEAASYSGEWRVDETMQALAAEGIEAIVVGVPNAGSDRITEYVPHRTEHGPGRADEYLSFLTAVVKPFVDGSLQTLKERATTGLMGSSLGGVVSLYGLFARPDVFGLAGAMSSTLWWPGGAIVPYLERSSFVDARIYMDVGSDEIPEEPEVSAAYLRVYHEACDVFRDKGYGEDRFMGVVEEGAIHEEAAWARRLPDALRFLLGP